MRWARIFLSLLWSFLNVTSVYAVTAWASFQAVSGGGWNQIHIGGGGYVTGMNQSADGKTMVARVDVWGGYVSYNGGAWQELVTSQSIPSSIWSGTWALTTCCGGTPARSGPYEIAVAPSNNSVIYMIWWGDLLISTNRGVTFSICGGWSQIDLATQAGNTNSVYRYQGPHIAVDPANPDVAYIGTPKAGVFLITSGTSTCTVTSLSPSTIPTATSDGSGNYPGYVIAFDANSGTTGGKTDDIYIAGWGNDVYGSTNAGSSFASLSSGTSSWTAMTVCSDHTLWFADGTTSASNLWKFASGAWTGVTSATTGQGDAVHNIACDPNNAAHVVIAGGGGNAINWTSNTGSTWSEEYYYTYSNHPGGVAATDVPWLQWQYTGVFNVSLSAGSMFFDAVTANRLWLSAGFGAFYATEITTTLGAPGIGTYTWNSFTAGIEAEDAVGACSTPNGGGSIMLESEQLLWYLTNPTSVYPANGTPSNVVSIIGTGYNLLSGWSCDYLASSPNTVVGLVNGPINSATDASGYSSNAGATWTNFATPPLVAAGKVGGSIAMASPNNILVLPANTSTSPVLTTNNGSSWSNPSGLPSSGWGGQQWAFPKQACADKVMAGTYYLMNTNLTASGGGLYVSANNGSTWSLASGLPGNIQGGIQNHLVCVPNNAGHLIWNPGNGYLASGTGLYFSSNAGLSWVTIPNVTNVIGVSVGAPKPGGNGYSVIWVAGMVNSVYGLWRCDDYNSTANNGCNSGNWVNVGTYPINSLDSIVSFDGDLNVYNRAYVGFGGSGFSQLN